jgi:DNA topoisomerase I
MRSIKIEKIIADPVKTATAAGLRYVSDSLPGITRIRKGKGWAYLFADGTKCTDEDTLRRIRDLVLPPAWKNVWICPYENGHLQATGYDKLNRKQYKYHIDWSKIRSQTKYYRLMQFGSMLPKIRGTIEKDLRRQGLCQRKVLAIVVSLMERTFIRIGNSSYEKMYGSYGLTTLRDKHVEINGSSMRFEFKGKKGVYQSVELKSRRLANLVRKCREIPGQELFQYYDNNGLRHPIDSGMVNDYLKEITGCDFTAKDFRTWAGTLCALRAFRDIGPSTSISHMKRNIVRVVDAVSGQLGNTRSICKKYYIHPSILSAYEEGCLADYFNELEKLENDEIAGLTCEEKLLMQILYERTPAAIEAA